MIYQEGNFSITPLDAPVHADNVLSCTTKIPFWRSCMVNITGQSKSQQQVLGGEGNNWTWSADSDNSWYLIA